MRFNDLIATALASRADGRRARATLWRQCIDLLAQFDTMDADERSEADLFRVAQMLDDLRPLVSIEQKLSAVSEIRGRLTSPRLVHLLMQEHSAVQVTAMRHARLPDAAWPAVISAASPLARSILRERADLGPEARATLALFGPVDLRLADLSAGTKGSSTANAPEPPARDPDHIKRIVDRIERFTSARTERRSSGVVTGDREAAATVSPGDSSGAIAQFTFTTDASGSLDNVLGAPRAAVSGLSLGTPSLACNAGPDGQILGAFKRRGAFSDGRLTVDTGLLAGCWLVSGEPLFDRRSGRFTGYRGSARRAGGMDVAPVLAGECPSAGAQPHTTDATSLLQLIHELRSPLHGVMGFAELIESQVLGPVGDSYRTMAGDIVTDVRSLVDILDDLDLANRDDHVAAPGRERTDAINLLVSAIERFAVDSTGRPHIALNDGKSFHPLVDVSPPTAERMIAHFVRALSTCADDSILGATYHSDGAMLSICVDRPVSTLSLDEAQLLDTGFDHDGANGPALGVGFALRLVRRLAHANGGALSVLPASFILALPVAERQQDGQGAEA